MFSSKQLTEEQIQSIKQWASEGAQLPDIQLRMREQMDLPLTYMDTRFVILDLGIELEKKEEYPAVVEVLEPEQVTPTGQTQVTMDTIALPGALVSGKVIFSDGEKAIWKLDQTGRPSLDPNTPGYQPSQEDIVQFQQQLRSLIEKSGL
jgi:hypothetical protein